MTYAGEAQKPTIGRVVHYVLANGQHRKADVVNVFGTTHANLLVTLDPMSDTYPPSLIPEGSGGQAISTCFLAVGSAAFDEYQKPPGTWHWPERE